MATLKIKKGDTVKVIAGRDKDKEGKVLSVNVKAGTLIVEGVNMIKKHSKPNKDNQEGGIITVEGPIHISNVMYVHKGQPTRIGFHVDENGKKVRYAKSTKEAID
ncbi:MAG: 50S ribosomal protein L24 [Lachnospiraceae bacterium]|nr:50S ribosomal protein L24 [Lachnospiraceae bacterium]MBR6349645.1 50S ribosomal protein L24 [Lachnospiraceae bacterium]